MGTACALGAGDLGALLVTHPPTQVVPSWREAHGHARTGVRWEVYDHWRDDPATFETAVFWLLAR